MESVHYIDKDSDTLEVQMEMIRNRIQDTNSEEILRYVEYLESEWGINKTGDTHWGMTVGFQKFCREHECDENGLPMTIDIKRISTQYKNQVETLGQIYHRAFSLNISDEPSLDINKNEFTVSSRINRLIHFADHAKRIVLSYAMINEYMNNPTSIPENADCDPVLFHASTMAMDDLSPYQQLILVVLNETYASNIRRYKGQCCKEIEVISGMKKFRTKAWKPIMQISDYVYSIAQKESRFEVWKNLTAKGNTARDAIKHLSECKDMQFPEIKKNRNVWSFNNGLFVGKEWSTKTGKYMCKFYSYESTEFSCLDPTIMSARYFDKHFPNFDHIEDWYDIPTPYFQSILDYQNFDIDVAKWMYVMGGKLCFDVGDIDSWQIIPFLKGIARSGKSTLITKVFKKFYESEDVRTLSNNIERKFGLSSIYDGFMFIAPEVKGDLCLEQAEFQSLVSGEDVSIAQKYEKAKSVEWKTPGILGGNEVPNWKDNSGSVLRRLLPWNFSKQVKDADPQLDEKLDIELPAILLKCVKGYLDFAQKYANKDIWNVVPEYFKSVQTQVAMVTNTLQNFLASEKLRYGKDLFVPQKMFVQVFNQHCQENNLGRVKFNPDFYGGPFSSRDIEVRMEAKTYKGRTYPAQPIVFGVDVVDESIQFTDDY
jgi:hypothetical protein